MKDFERRLHDILYGIRGFVLSVYRVFFGIVKYTAKTVAFVISALSK